MTDRTLTKAQAKEGVFCSTTLSHRLIVGGRVLFGVLQGKVGTLRYWPFRLLYNDEEITRDTLNGIETANSFRNGLWWSDGAGRYRFEQVPDENYHVEIVTLGGSLVTKEKTIPKGAYEHGQRDPHPEPLVQIHEESPDLPSILDLPADED